MDGVISLFVIFGVFFVLYVLVDEFTKEPEPSPPPEKTKEEKKMIAKAALETGDIKGTAEKFGVTEEEVKAWINEFIKEIKTAEHDKEDLLDMLIRKI